MSIEAVKNVRDSNNREKKNSKSINTTLQGVLVNSHLRVLQNEQYSFENIKDSLLISNSQKYYNIQKEDREKNDSVFDVKKAIIPILIGSSAIMGGSFAISAFLKKASKNLLQTKKFEHLPDLAINMNIREEPQFAIYRAIRDPNFRNIAAMTSVFLMSGIVVACKNFVDGVKEVWVKKQNADIEKNLQENLISVERDIFSGKLKVVNDMMNENVKYFDSVLNFNKDNCDKDITSFSKKSNIFKQFKTSFSGTKKEKKEDNINNIKYIGLSALVLLAGGIIGKYSHANIKATLRNAKKFAEEYTQTSINAIDEISNKADKKDIPLITELMKSICAKPEYIRDIGKKYNLKENEIEKIIDSVEETKKTIFADAPTALGGIPKKVQYYCYIDEPRGHLYNWILNPDNKFTKYIFQAFTVSGAVGYVFNQGMEAVKEAAVMRENAKTELDLKKRLVAIEIESFKQKKESAVNPLVDSFEKQIEERKKSKKELKQIADNILMEIKNGPPYVYN